MDICFCLPRCY